MELHQLILFLFLALVAEILGTIGGFGSSVFFVPIAAFFFDFHSVLGITAMFHITSNASKIYLFRKGIDKHVVFYFGIPAVLLVISGALLSKYINEKTLELSLSIFLILLSIALIAARNKKFNASKTWLVGGGSLSGFVAGLVGTGGAIRGLALSALSLGKDSFIATSAIIDMGIDASRTIVYGLNGYIHLHDLYLIPFLLVIGYGGSWLGKYLLQFISENQFKLIVLLLICAIGLATLFKLTFGWFN